MVVCLFAVLPISIEGMEAFLKKNPNISLAGKSDNYNQTILDIKSKQPDLLIVDDTCVESGELFKFLEKINKCNWKRKVLIYTSSNNSTYLKKIIYSGIKSILHKKSPLEKLIEALEAISIIGIYIDENITSIILNKSLTSSQPDDKIPRTLTDREKEVFFLIKSGMNNEEIAEKLFISRRTVEVHKTNIVKKLGMKSRKELIKFVLTDHS